MFKQILIASVAVSGLNGVAAAAQPSAAQAPATQPAAVPADQACVLPKIADTAPLQQLSGAGLMTVPVVINGKTKQFLLDLALKKPSEVSPATMAELGLPQDPKRTELIRYGVNGPGMKSYDGLQAPVYDVRDNSGVASLDTHVRVGSFTVGDATDHNMQFLVTKKGEIGRSAPYDGFLTGDFFRQYDVELDFGKGQMTWLTPTKCTDPDKVVFWPHAEVAIIPVSLANDGRLQMQAMVRGHLISAEIDTSSAHTVMRRDIAELYVGVADKDMLPVGDLEDGCSMQIYVSTFPQIIFAGGGITAMNVPVLIQDYSMHHDLDQAVLGTHSQFRDERIPDLTIGMDVLHNLHMYVIPGQGRIYVTSAAPMPSAPGD